MALLFGGETLHLRDSAHSAPIGSIAATATGTLERFYSGLLGANGEGPTGASPLVYMTGPAVDWEAGANKGTGGDWTRLGMAVTAAGRRICDQETC